MTEPSRIRLTDPLRPRTDLSGRTAVVTGGASGLGFVTSGTLAERGATVIIGTRNTARGEEARAALLDRHGLPGDRIRVERLDLIDLASVQRFAAAALSSADAPLDLLVLNAASSSGPLRHDANGVESQFATNHLGHFALAGLLLPALESGTDPRVVTVSSVLYTAGRLDVDQLADAGRYSPGGAYNRSKLANALFAIELQRRLASSGSPVRSFGAHPGMARTPLHATYPSAATRVLTRTLARVIGRDPGPADVGVLTAALHPDVRPDRFWGPTGSRSHPDALGVPYAGAATDRAAAEALWTASERLTGIVYPGPAQRVRN